MDFKWSIDLGGVINVVSLCLIAFAGMKKIGALELKMTLLWDWFQREHGIEK